MTENINKICNMDCFNCPFEDCIRDDRQDDRDRRMDYYYAHKELESQRRKERYKRNAEKEKAYAREYRRQRQNDEGYRKKNKERCKEWADNNKDIKSACQRRYYERNREKILEYQRNYRLQKSMKKQAAAN